MPLAIGSHFGPYEILSPLGVGGMGEVYRVRDAKLNRDVALKVLRPEVAHDSERLARFRREAQLLASLNHQNIAQVYGFEDAGGHHGLLMELVEGETLADRIGRGALPLDEALAIAKQIAEALEAAHERGIIHRDLKPANVKAREDGTVKVLDFGLAKALDPRSAGEARQESQYADSPTFTAAMTMPGIILGTAGYMPPEQVKGRPVDRRADLWAFGCVLFEMLTGRRPFEGETTSDVLARIIEREPDWSALPAATPRSIHRLLARCLVKDRRQRLDSAAAARLEIDDASQAANQVAASDAGRAEWTRWTIGAVVMLTGIAGAVTAWTLKPPAEPLPDPVTRFAITLPPTQPIAYSINDRDLALSADGTRLAFTAGDRAQLMVRRLDQLDAHALPGTDHARAPVFSPDGRWVAFFDQLDEGVTTGPVVQRGALKKVSLGGGPPTTIASLTGASRGASWAADDSILFATSDRSSGILRVRAGGGETEVLTRPDGARGEEDHLFPSALPGKHAVLFTITSVGPGENRIALYDLKTREQRTVIRSGNQAEYVDTGHLIYIDRGALWAIPFDLETLVTIGDAVALNERVLVLGAANFAISRSGTLAYLPERAGGSRSLVWVDRSGRQQPIPLPPRTYRNARLSPDGKRVALHVFDQSHQIWTSDLATPRLTRLTFLTANNLPGGWGDTLALWTRDGKRLIFGSAREVANRANLYRQAVDGTAAVERLTNSARQQRVNSLSPDGTLLVFEELSANGSYDFKLLRLDDKPNVHPLLETQFDERNAEISPDGRWMAYDSNESGQNQIYVRPFPNVNDAKQQVSTEGGRTPAWSPDGRELFFVNGLSMMSVPVKLTPAFVAENPVKRFDAHGIVIDGRLGGVGGGGSSLRTYDVAPDGQRFLMMRDASGEGDAPGGGMIVVQHWFQELKAKMAEAAR